MKNNSNPEVTIKVNFDMSDAETTIEEFINKHKLLNGIAEPKEEYKTMDDSVKSFVKHKEKIEKRNMELSNQIIWYAQDHAMSLEEVMECMEAVKKAYYISGIIKKAE